MFKKLKTLLYPLTFRKKDFSIYMIANLYDGFQSVFLVQVLAFIVGAIQSKNLQDFYFWIGVFILVEVFSIIFIFIGNRYFAKTFYGMMDALRGIYLEKYINLDNNKVESIGTGRFNSIIWSGIHSWVDISMGHVSDMIIILFSISYALLIVLFSAGFMYFILILVIFLLLFIFITYGNNASLKYRKLRKNEGVEFDKNFLKIIMSKFEILQNSKIRKEEERLLNISKNVVYYRTKEEFIGSIWTSGIRGIFVIMQLLVFFGLGFGVIRGTVELYHFILINGLIETMNKYVWGFSKQVKAILVTIVDVDKLLDTFENIEEIRGINNPKRFEYSRGDISLKNVTYCYNESCDIFDSFSLDIRGGLKTAIVGPSGGGKSTLIKLIASYIHPTGGDISVDDQKLSDINLISYYKNIGYLTQEPSVFDGTIMDNLTYALDHDIDPSKLDEIIISSRCEFINELPKGLETEIGERGIKLSGGQKQRLAIAKIMLKNPNIILLDEPTSALDSISEQAVSEALHNLFRGRTVIVIAHRLQTVKEADDIIVIKQGKIIERGNHEILSKMDGEYRKMLDLQTSF
ncbi:MAG: ABC transporter ATP-binding protein [Candidatus Gracilibacteria bacterium]|nr:ABC transporter ATP-binding protein [Candidatus Gracilibacteria bacterium]